MIYELWDLATINLVGSYETEIEALDDVREAVARHGAGYVDGLALICEDARGRSRTLAEGGALLERADAEVLALRTADR